MNIAEEKTEQVVRSPDKRFSEFDQYNFMSESDWKKGEIWPGYGQIILSAIIAGAGVYIGDYIAILVLGAIAFFVALSGWGLMNSKRYRIALNGGWPLDTIEKQCSVFRKDWAHYFDGLEFSGDKPLVWGSLKARFAYGLIPGLIRDNNTLGRVRKGFFISHYCYLRHARHPKLKHWQPLALFLEGDVEKVEKKLKGLNAEVRKSLLQECQSVHIGQCIDPILIQPLSGLWCGSKNLEKPVAVIM